MKSADVSSLGDEEENSSAQDRQRLMAMTEAAITRMSALNSVGSEFFEFIHASALTFASKMYPRGDASSEVNLHNLVPFVFEDSRSKYLSFIYASTDSSITLFETLKDKTEAVEESNLIFNAVHKSKKSSQLAAYEVAKSGPIWLDNKILSSAKCDELLRGPSPIEVFNSLRAKYDSSSCSYKCATRAPCLPRCKL